MQENILSDSITIKEEPLDTNLMENNLVAIKQKNIEKNEHEEEKEIIVLQKLI